jgi:3-dehydroquinate dehydratase/shikimate dehydrogenase
MAALESIDASLGRGGEIDVLSGKSAIVLGAGGMAKAVTYALRTRDVEVAIAARSFEKAAELAEQFRCRPVDWSNRHSQNAEIVINCTPVGMHPHVDDTPFQGEYLRRAMIVFDTVYNPEQTLLVKQARDKECYVITGVDLFVRQAVAQFQYFADQPGPGDIMRQEILREIGAAKQ